jgi:hypothetical protein
MLSISCSVITVPSRVAVSTSGASPVTVIVSARPPTGSVKRSVVS